MRSGAHVDPLTRHSPALRSTGRIKSHDEFVLRRAIVFPACWLLARLASSLTSPILRMVSPLVFSGRRRRFQHPLWLDPGLGAWPGGSHAASLLGDFTLVGDVGHRKSPDLSKRGGVSPDQCLAEWSRQHALLECINQHFFIFGRRSHHLRSKTIQVVPEGLSLILPYIKQNRKTPWAVPYSRCTARQKSSRTVGNWLCDR